MGEAALVPIATAVIYEDDHVRVWTQIVPEGGSIERHRHELDYCLVNVLGEGPFDVTFHEGTGGRLGEQATFSPRPRTADFVRAGHVETARNRGSEYRAILIEFKSEFKRP